jgi:hypothetical protein
LQIILNIFIDLPRGRDTHYADVVAVAEDFSFHHGDKIVTLMETNQGVVGKQAPFLITINSEI